MNESQDYTWHNCDGKIGQYLRYITKPDADFNDGVPTWAIVVHEPTYVWAYVPVKYCPVCGEMLE